MKKIIAGFLSLAILFPFFTAPAFASVSVGTVVDVVNFGTFLMNLFEDLDESDFPFSDSPVYKFFNQGLMSRDSSCSSSDSPDGHHQVDPDFPLHYTEGDPFCTPRCKYCGQLFTLLPEDLDFSYDAQVSELPATGVTSSGGLIWRPRWQDFSNKSDFSTSEFLLTRNDASDTIPCDFSSHQYVYWTFNRIDDYSMLITWAEVSGASMFSFGLNYLKAPISGYYSSIPNFTYSSIEYLFSSSVKVNTLSNSSVFIPLIFCNAGDSLKIAGYSSGYLEGFWSPTSSHRNYLFTFPILIQPDDQSVVTNNYTIDSRPTSITGDYGIIGDNGQITKVDNTTIVNETNNIYTNPSTGTTSTITEWTYDYSDRSYNVTLESGDTVTVTYGDENVTIMEGDTIYNVYYIIEGTGSGGDTPGTGTCQHEYTSTVDREPSCTVPGQTTYTCSLCGHTYTEAIQAIGHSWTVLKTVTTEYDEQGNLLQQGYTIYGCSVCGEQYKDETGTGPPGSGGSGGSSGEEGGSIWDKLGDLVGSGIGGILSLLEAVVGAILDALISLVTMINEKLGQVVTLVLGFFDHIPGLFTGFLGFLGVVFSFLPEDVMLLLTFGIAMIVFIGIIKALRR